MRKIKDFIKSPYGLLIVVSWIALILCLIIKIFGGNWFELWLDNDKFISFCKFVDDTQWLKMVLAFIIGIFTTYPLMCLIYNVKYYKGLWIILYIIIMSLKSLSCWYFKLGSYIIDLLILIIIPMIITKNWKRPIIVNIIIMTLQLLTILIRNVNSGLNAADTFIEQFLIQIDYYLMLLLFYLYNTKKLKKEVV